MVICDRFFLRHMACEAGRVTSHNNSVTDEVFLSDPMYNAVKMKTTQSISLRLRAAVLAIASTILLAGGASAQSLVATENVESELLSEVLEAAPGDTFWVALRQKIRPGWHTYWKNPGDAGAPIDIEWTLPDGAEVSEIYWPVPKRIPEGPLMTYGFKDEILLLSQITLPDGSPGAGAFGLSAFARWLVCADICIPEEAELRLELKTGSESIPDLIWGGKIQTAVDALPIPLPSNALLSRSGEKVRLNVKAPEWRAGFDQQSIQDIYFFPEQDGLLKYADDHTIRFGDEGFVIDFGPGYKVRESGGDIPFETVSGLLVVEEEAGTVMRSAYRLTAEIGDAPQNVADQIYVPPGQATISVSFLTALIYAVIGGLLLNLMPCVFPVLSIKALSLLEHAQRTPRDLRFGGVAYAAGVIVSFLVLAGALLAFRAVGENVGWGFQLQSPIVIILISYLMLLVGLNLSGFFEVTGRLAGMGSSAAAEKGLRGSFATGVLAVIVATPCTAPFMGVAMGYALFQSAPVALAVFVGLGFGLALPYLLLTFVPALGNRLPKPGAWMVTFKKILAVPMYATVLWLIWVLSQQVSTTALLVALAGLVLVGFGAFLYGRLQREGSVAWSAIAVTVLALILAPISASSLPPQDGLSQAKNTSGLPFDPYSAERIETLRAGGQHVFVNFTAAWCITCLVNEQVVFSDASVRAVFEDGTVAYVKADWTNRDPIITDALAQYDRAGVPLYVLYPAAGAGEDDGQVLPQILTPSAFLDALEKL